MFCRQFSIRTEIEFDEEPGDIGGSSSYRKCTDLPAIIVMVLFFGLSIALFAYCFKYGDLDKVLGNYDDCGNICGKNNINNNNPKSFKCSGKNMEKLKIVKIDTIDDYPKPMFGSISNRRCVENCNISGGYIFSKNYCVFDKSYIPFASDLFLYWKYVILSWFVSAIFSFALLTLLIYHLNVLLKSILIILNISLLSITVFLWFWWQFLSSYYYSRIKTFAGALISTIFCILVFLFTYNMALKITLVNQLFREAADALTAMPQLLLHPFLTSFLKAFIILVGVYSYLWLQSVSYLDGFKFVYIESVFEFTYQEYILYPIAILTLTLMLISLSWLIEFVKNFQCMVVGGCVAKWFYTRKSGLFVKPIRTTLSNILKYHLGTICFGSGLLNILYIFRLITDYIKQNGNAKDTVCSFWFRYMSEMFFSFLVYYLDFMSQNSYIMTAIYGYAFCKAAARTTKLILQNFYNILVLNAIGNFILISARIIVCIFSTFIGFCVIHYDDNVQQYINMLILYICVSFLTIYSFTAQLEVSMDTILLCFCEDCKLNDGVSKPYYMSPNLTRFVEEANKYTDPIKWKKFADKLELGTKHV